MLLLSAVSSPEPSKRHDEGVYYTPAHVTRYLVDLALGRALAERRGAILDRARLEEGRDEMERVAASIAAWEAYRDGLLRVRVLDPACGAGALLVAAYDALAREYERVARELSGLRRERGAAFDVPGAILGNNLFGVDISSGAVEAARRALSVRAERAGPGSGRLHDHLRWGDSIVSAPALSPAAFDWARWGEGFDVVIGNPPYVRHELFTRLKAHLRKSFEAYHGMADMYVYFFERALSVMKPGGRLGFLVSNKWLRAGYAAPLRTLLARRTEIEALIDLGHARVFEGADTSLCLISLRKLAGGERVDPAHDLSVTALPRSEALRIDFAGYVASHAHPVPQARLGWEPWSLLPSAVEALYRKIQAAGVPLCELAGVKPCYGIKTGLNEAFFVDEQQRTALLREDPGSERILRPCLRGQDIGRWRVERSGTWLICARRGVDIDSYPAVRRHLERFRARLAPRPPGASGRGWPGRRSGPYQWYELQDPVAYWDLFDRPKIVYQVIQFHPRFALDESGLLLNDKAFFIPSSDPWLLAVLSSPLMWWHNWRWLGHMKDEALNPAGARMARLPIAPPDEEARRIAAELVRRLAAPEQDRVRALEMERRLAELVNRAYGLTPEEVDLLWATAPPRMPAAR